MHRSIGPDISCSETELFLKAIIFNIVSYIIIDTTAVRCTILTAVAQSHTSFKYPKINSDAFLLETIKSVTLLFPSKTGNHGAIIIIIHFTCAAITLQLVDVLHTCEFCTSRVRYIWNLQLQETKICILRALRKQLYFDGRNALV